MTMPLTQAHPEHVARNDAEAIRAYSYYALSALAAASFLNAMDRQIVAILAQSIKTTLSLSDAQMGFLLGTAFAVFFAIVGIGVGRLADAVPRTRLLASGLAVWSVMTALAGFATSFSLLAFSRIGVGVGEATGTPCAHSLLSQYFPQRHRARVIGVFIAALYLGGACSMLLGGLMLQDWPQLCRASGIEQLCQVPAWRAALILVGLPGIPLAFVLARLREPVRASLPRVPFLRTAVMELGAALPPFTLILLAKLGGFRALLSNLVLAAAVTALAVLLGRVSGDVAQWAAISLGIYSILTWVHVLRLRDRPMLQLSLGSRTFLYAMLGSSMLTIIGSAVSAWAATLAMRTFAIAPGALGVSMGLVIALPSSLGAVIGGVVTDRWKRSDPRAPVWVGLVALLVPIPAVLVMVSTDKFSTYLLACAFFNLLFATWASAFGALAQDLVLPRMRGTAASMFSLINIVIGVGLGPYWVGKVSTLTGSLSKGVLSVELVTPLAAGILLLTARRLRRESAADRQLRAEAAGERPEVVVAA